MIGWVLLSREAVARADEALTAGDRGVRDEVGFQSIHQAVADRLFPGTSVLHTRARYALLVPWLMARVAVSGGDDLERRLLEAEGRLAGQFVLGKEQELDTDGAIGVEVWAERRRPPAQPPSFSYWSALREWGILRRTPDRTTPRRRDVLRQLARRGGARRVAEDDPDPRAAGAPPFVELPPAPAELGQWTKPLGLALTPDERRFLRDQLITVRRNDDQLSLLARLAEARSGGDVEEPWAPGVTAVADAADGQILRVAREAAALVAVGRGVYGALVEQIWNADRNGGSHLHADALTEARVTYGPQARKLDVSELGELFPTLPADLRDLLRQTQSWLRDGDLSPRRLRDVYTAAEDARKDIRSKLTTRFSGRRRRDDWLPEKHPPPRPIGYRWPNVSRLLRDVAG